MLKVSIIFLTSPPRFLSVTSEFRGELKENFSFIVAVRMNYVLLWTRQFIFSFFNVHFVVKFQVIRTSRDFLATELLENYDS